MKFVGIFCWSFLPAGVGEDAHVARGDPQLADHVRVADDHDEARRGQQHDALVDGEDAAVAAVLAIVDRHRFDAVREQRRIHFLHSPPPPPQKQNIELPFAITEVTIGIRAAGEDRINYEQSWFFSYYVECSCVAIVFD